MNKKSNIAVMGSNGFVGRNLSTRLSNDGYENIHNFHRGNINLLNADEVYSAISFYNIDVVFICSAVVGGIQTNINNPYKFLFENLVIQNNIIDACIKNKVKQVVFLGSSCIYPKDYKQPLKEEYLMKDDLEPSNYGYALAKICGLKMCEFANKEFDTQFISLMPCNLYGNDQDYDPIKSHVLGALVKRIVDAKHNGDKEVVVWGTGKPKREFLHITDCVDAMIWSIHNAEKCKEYDFINIGTGTDMSIRRLAEKIKKYSGYIGEIKFDVNKPDGMKRKCLDITRINNIGWKHNIELDDGLLRTVKDYEKNKLS